MLRLRRLSPLALLVLASASACATDDETPADTDADATDTDGEDTPRVSYYDDVLPIFADHCMGCHVEGGVGPFIIDDVEEARAWGPAIAVSVAARTMPPFGVNNDGSCNTFRDANWLTEEEIETIAAWVEQGTPDGERPAVMPTAPAPVVLASADVLELHTPSGYTPVPETYAGGEYEDYQCFLIEPDFEHDRFVVGFDVIPGNPSTVHHVIGFEVNPGAFDNAAQMAALDALSPDQPGWDCLSAAGDDVFPEGTPVTWAPGVGATNFPDDTGIRIEAGHVFVVQMHYNLLNDGDAGDTTVQVALADEVQREAHQSLIDPFLFESFSADPTTLPPGEESVTYEWSMPMADATFLGGEGEIEVLGVLPHMHQRGRRMSIDFDVADSEVCGADVDRYDFDWQRAYFLETPIPMTLADSIRVTCDWDTRSDSTPVRPGFGTADEMCLVGLFVVAK
jgi:hypothetical protein